MILCRRKKNIQPLRGPCSLNICFHLFRLTTLQVNTVFLAFLAPNKNKHKDRLKVYEHPCGTRLASHIMAEMLFEFLCFAEKGQLIFDIQ